MSNGELYLADEFNYLHRFDNYAWKKNENGYYRSKQRNPTHNYLLSSNGSNNGILDQVRTMLNNEQSWRGDQRGLRGQVKGNRIQNTPSE